MTGDPTTFADVEARVRALVARGDRAGATTVAVQALAPEVLGFLSAVMRSDADADEVFAAVSERLWRSLETFAWRCSLRTWVYVIARREADRHRRGMRRHVEGRERISELQETIAVARSSMSSQRDRLARLRDELPVEDRELLVLRVDRELAWDQVALAFVDDPQNGSDEELRRVEARLRKRFQLIKERLAARAREEGLWSK
jgi:RNA polymerase sigma-70 factor (ECF subfamily)